MSFIAQFAISDLAASAPLAYIGPGAGITFLGSFLALLIAFVLLALSLVTWPFRFLYLWLRRKVRGITPTSARVVVLGLDGLDPGRVRRLIEEGRLPNLKRLSAQGTFTDLKTTLPPISPVAWSSFQTGVNPGKHNIFDFLNRDLRTYLPELSSAKIVERPAAGWLSRLGLPGASLRLLRKSQPFWKVLGDHGVFSTILRVPISFPPEKFFGLSLSAMCTPDLRGTQGSFTLLTTDEQECHEATGGLRLPVRRIGDRIDAWLPGPPKTTGPGNRSGEAPAEFRALLKIQIDPQLNEMTLATGRQRIRLGLNQESGWVRVTFRCGLFTRVSGICRFRLLSLAPHFRLYVSPIHLDPERPAMPISHPFYYSIYLAKLHDAFATLGLAEDTWALNSEVIGEDAFLEQAYAIHDERTRMFLDAVRRTRRGLAVCVFDAPDRIQHMFYRHENPDHPANAGRDCTRHARVIDEMYVRMDELVGRVAGELDDDAVLLVISDHGFCEFRRAVNLNVWLREHGYLALRDDVPAGDYLAGVDWSKTRAYAFGLSGIYINEAGREAQGIVPRDESASLRREIAAKLISLRDGEADSRPIRNVYDSRDVYHGPYASNGPDLIVGYFRGYRASWDNAVGRSDGPLIQDNRRYWSGDHCVDPGQVPGVFFCNRPFQEEAPSILDLAPTILELFGIPVPQYMDGRPLSPPDRPAAKPPAEIQQPVPVGEAK